jgi:diguanylate cyclase
MCLMMLDIDRFKEINDRHGHLIGDKVIKYVATTLKRLVRGGDFVARYGGEEFGIILDDTPEKGAIIVAENVRATIEQAMLKRTDTGDPIGTVTVSIGISRYGKGDTGESLLDRADRALYHAKQEGRNRVSFTSR